MSDQGPKRCNLFAHNLGRTVLAATGWTKAGGVPAERNMVIIAAPHTSNWDFIYLLAAAYAFGISVNWLGKDSLFRFPLGPLLRWLGGIPVDRSRPGNLVSQLAEHIQSGEGVVLAIPPAGTRKYTEYWKSGFYRIAEATRIPMVCGYLDYEKKEAGLGPSFMTTELTHDMDRLRTFYQPIRGRYPALTSRVRLRDEDA